MGGSYSATVVVLLNGTTPVRFGLEYFECPKRNLTGLSSLDSVIQTGVLLLLLAGLVRWTASNNRLREAEEDGVTSKNAIVSVTDDGLRGKSADLGDEWI